MIRKVRLETGDVTQSIKYTNMKTLQKNFQLRCTGLKAPSDFHVILQRVFSGRWLSPPVCFYVLGKHVKKPFSTEVRKGKNGKKKKRQGENFLPIN